MARKKKKKSKAAHLHPRVVESSRRPVAPHARRIVLKLAGDGVQRPRQEHCSRERHGGANALREEPPRRPQPARHPHLFCICICIYLYFPRLSPEGSPACARARTHARTRCGEVSELKYGRRRRACTVGTRKTPNTRHGCAWPKFPHSAQRGNTLLQRALNARAAVASAWNLHSTRVPPRRAPHARAHLGAPVSLHPGAGTSPKQGSRDVRGLDNVRAGIRSDHSHERIARDFTRYMWCCSSVLGACNAEVRPKAQSTGSEVHCSLLLHEYSLVAKSHHLIAR
jgi:hypothetical protein